MRNWISKQNKIQYFVVSWGKKGFSNSKVPHQKNSMTLVQLLLAYHSPSPVLLFVSFIISCSWRYYCHTTFASQASLIYYPWCIGPLLLGVACTTCICFWCWDGCFSVYPCHLSFVTLGFITEDICIYIYTINSCMEAYSGSLSCKMLTLTYLCSFTYSLWLQF